jgi:hypothetical protein
LKKNKKKGKLEKKKSHFGKKKKKEKRGNLEEKKMKKYKKKVKKKRRGIHCGLLL